MEAVPKNRQSKQFVLRGVCPHCSRPSVFVPVTSVAVLNTGIYVDKWIAGMECQGCTKYILGIVVDNQHTHNFYYDAHYPLGTPDDSVAEEIPEHIGRALSEAKRCLSVRAYNAAAVMCRRALEASCLDLGAPKHKVIQKMIDALEVTRIITPALRDAAHTIRLGGDRAVHPPEDGPSDEDILDGPIENIDKDQASDLVSFAEHFFQHVYVIPCQLKNNNYSRKGGRP